MTNTKLTIKSSLIIFIIIVLAVIAIYLYNTFFIFKTEPIVTPDQVINQNSDIQTSAAGPDIIAESYRGVLPCADCPGLDTEIVFKKSTQDSLDGSYTMKETYLERSVDPLNTQGTWKTVFSSSKGVPIIYFELSQIPEGNKQYYLKVDDSEIKMLDQNKEEIVAQDVNFSLKKQ